MLADAYPWIRMAHITLAVASGSLFALRGLGVLMGSTTAMAQPVRRLSVAIDSALLLAALMLLTALQGQPLGQPWLQAKLALLVAYIVLGVLALKRAPMPALRAVAFAAALLCFLCMFAIARQHDPLGFLAWLR